MRFSIIFAIAATVACAAPVTAQNNTAATPEDVTAVNLTEMNAETAATPAVQVSEPPATAEDTITVTGKRPFPWGVLGLVGLIGLLGRKRSTS